MQVYRKKLLVNNWICRWYETVESLRRKLRENHPSRRRRRIRKDSRLTFNCARDVLKFAGPEQNTDLAIVNIDSQVSRFSFIFFEARVRSHVRDSVFCRARARFRQKFDFWIFLLAIFVQMTQIFGKNDEVTPRLDCGIFYWPLKINVNFFSPFLRMRIKLLSPKRKIKKNCRLM